MVKIFYLFSSSRCSVVQQPMATLFLVSSQSRCYEYHQYHSHGSPKLSWTLTLSLFEQVERGNALRLAAASDQRSDRGGNWENLDSIHLRMCRALGWTRYPSLGRTLKILFCVHVLICASSDDGVLWVGYDTIESLRPKLHRRIWSSWQQCRLQK